MRVPDDALGVVLRIIVNQWSAEDLVLKLFVNDIIEIDDDSISRYIELPVGLGYEPIRLMGSNWDVIGGPNAEASYPEQQFRFNGPAGKVFGYLLVQERSESLIGVERFPDGPYEILRDGDRILVTPRLDMGRLV